MNFDVGGGGEEAKIEGLKDIFFDVFLLDCAEIIETFDVFESFTDFRLELAGNANDGSADAILIGCLFQELLLRRQTVIADISQHYDPVLTFLVAFVVSDPFQQHLF
jgi:hypothetical protein